MSDAKIGERLAPEDIKPVEGKTQVWVDGRLVADITDGSTPGREAMIPFEPTQEEIDADRQRAEITSKLAASRAASSKKTAAKAR